jgi:hypothetical protein
MIEAGNLFDGIPASLPAEQFSALLTARNVRIDRTGAGAVGAAAGAQ